MSLKFQWHLEDRMKPVNKKRIENLEKVLKKQTKRPRFAKVIHDASIPNFDPRDFGIDADVILMLPDNGRRYPNQKDI